MKTSAPSRHARRAHSATLVAAAAAVVAIYAPSCGVHAMTPAFVHGFPPASRPGAFFQPIPALSSRRSPDLLASPLTTLAPEGSKARGKLGGHFSTSCKVATKTPPGPGGELRGTPPQAAQAATISRNYVDALRGIEDPSVTALLEKAKALERSGSRAGAREVYDAVLAKDPANGRVWMKAFLLCKRSGDHEGCRVVIRTALKSLPGNAILWQAWADMERSLGKTDVARNLYERGLEANPHLASLYNSWGAMERSLGNTAEARRLFGLGLLKDPGSARLHLSLAVLEDVAGNTDDAKKLLLRGLGFEPNNAHLHHALGILEYKQHGLGEAREHFRAAAAADSDFTMAWLSWGRMEEELGNVELARAKYRAGCKTNGGRGSVQLWQAWARLEEKQGDYWAALEAYSTASGMYPNDADLMVEWAKLLERRGDAGASAKLLNKAVKADGGNAYAHQRLGQLSSRQRRWGEAREHYGAGLAVAREASGSEAARTTANILHSWALMESELGDVASARALFEEAAGLGLAEGWLYHWYAKFEAEHGDTWLARHFFARAINAAPRDPAPWADWGKLEARLGNEGRSKSYAARSSSLLVSKEMERGRVDAQRPLSRKWRKHA